MSKNSVLYHFGVLGWCRTSFDYKKLVSAVCLQFWLMFRILSPESHTSKKSELGSLMFKNSVLYHFGIRKQFRTSFVFNTMMSELCLQFWLVLLLKIGYSVQSLSSYYSYTEWNQKSSHTSNESTQNCLRVNKLRSNYLWCNLSN